MIKEWLKSVPGVQRIPSARIRPDELGTIRLNPHTREKVLSFVDWPHLLATKKGASALQCFGDDMLM